MLLRAVMPDDIPAWLEVAHQADEIVGKLTPDISVFYDGFDDYMNAKIKQREAFVAVDTATGKCLGIVAFSKNNNRITFLAVDKDADFQSVAHNMLQVTLKHMDNMKEITVNVLISDSEVIDQERKLYEEFGFVTTDKSVLEAGIPATVMKKCPLN